MTSCDVENSLAKLILHMPGIKDKIVDVFTKNQIFTVFDLLLHVPKSIVEQEASPGFCYMEAGRHYIVCGKVMGTKISGFGQKRRIEAIIQDETGRMSLVFFGPAVNYAQRILKDNAVITFSGEAKQFLGRIQMVHPKFLLDKSDKPSSHNLPTYSQLGGLTSANIKNIVDKALIDIKNAPMPDHVTDDFLKAYKLAPLTQALTTIHEPKETQANWDDRNKDPYFRRLAFEELLSFYLRLNLERQQEEHKSSVPIPKVDLEVLIEDFLPFTLTKAQARVIREIMVDMKQKKAMARLLQGDVGSGKTAVSAVVALHTAVNNLQVAVMAPTEILAEQLFHVYQNLFAKKSLSIALLTSGTKSKERKSILEKINAQEIAIVIGTHALLSNDVKFKQLGLVIIDEQHRFGVKQRADLINSCTTSQEFYPHLLVMSATPIPRSLALTAYGDLELSIIDEKPQGRIPVHTQAFFGPVLKTMERLCERVLATKQKAFIVFPLVEESENLDLENATKALTLLQSKFGTQSATLLHGKMKPEEKASAIAEFTRNNISFLVATTIIEVGIDIPDATCMLIVHPERFGLAQLHQLRGRVGRKDLKSFCFLITDLPNKFGPAFKRLNAMCKTDNGFKLAEIDLEIRGPGDMLGIKQSGLPHFMIFSHHEFADLVSPAKNYAKSIAQQGLKKEHLHLFLHKEAHFS